MASQSSLPCSRDLRQIGSYGFCWSKQIGNAQVSEAGGLFGGAVNFMLVSTAAIAAATGQDSAQALIGAVGMLGR